jgi:two-component system, OmpR family, sensor kinase
VSLRARLVLAAAYLLTAVVLALTLPLALNVERRAESEFEANVLGRTAVLAAQIADGVAAANRRAVPTRVPPRVAAIVRETTRGTNERILVTDSRGRVLADTTGTAEVGAVYATEERPELLAALSGRVDTRSRASETLGEELLLVTLPLVDEERVVGAVRVSVPTAAQAASVRESWFRLALIGLAVVAAGLALAWFLARSLAAPVARLDRAAGRLAGGELETRVPEDGPSELARLARSFNRMAAALGASLGAQRDFIANASHQLRTPLAGLKLRLEAIRAEGGQAADEAEKAEGEVDRLNALVGDLLELARASSPEATGRQVDLGRVAREAVDRWRDGAAAAEMRIELDVAAAPSVWASDADLAHVVDNLVENALRYCPAGTTIRIGATDGRRPALTVADDGPGITPADRERVFERFFRGSNGRRAGPGTGLGLAIVAELAQRWNADVRLLDGPGTRVEVSFPPTVS